jgi:ribose transport system permease protein
VSMSQASVLKDKKVITDFAKRNGMTISLYVVVIILFLIGGFLSSGFLEIKHIGIILRTVSFLGIVAIGQTLVVLTGGIDLSVGPLVTMGNVFICMFLGGLDSNNLWAFCAIILIGLAVGTISGLGVSYLKISPLVMTLAVGSLVTGFMLIFSHGAPTGRASPLLHQIGIGYLFGSIPIIVIIWILLSIFTIVMLGSTTYGRKLYLTGASDKVAHLSGVNVLWIRTVAYALSGAFATLAGVCMAGYTQTAYLGIGNDYIMWSITAVVIGGTSLSGGKGGYVGTIAGAIIILLLESLLTIINVPEAGRQIAGGLIILIMITIYFRKPRNK